MKYIYDILMNFSDILFPSFSESTEKIANWRSTWEMYGSTHSSPRHYMIVGGQHHVPAALTPVHIRQEAGRTPE
jgi:hypothetical protein